MDHDHALAGNDIFADVFAVIATTHFDDDHDLSKLAVNFDIAQPDDVIGEERDRIVAEGKSGKRILHFYRAENRNPGPRQLHDHSIKRLAKVLAETRRQRHLKTDKRIDHQSFRADSFDGIEDRLHGFIHRKVERTKVDDFQLPLFLWRF